ncbi:MAG: hypothetical protein H7Y15_05585, partial [Pseudonocardia sp.]|nr:hypothetical protein [Pseudonocardia sp.]
MTTDWEHAAASGPAARTQPLICTTASAPPTAPGTARLRNAEHRNAEHRNAEHRNA